jgi:hypothetical protein
MWAIDAAIMLAKGPEGREARHMYMTFGGAVAEGTAGEAERRMGTECG